jgi:integrase
VKDRNVKLLRDKFMLTVNESSGHTSLREITVVNFFEKTYLPFITANLRASTVHGYAKIWRQHLKGHFGRMTLKEYRTHLGSQLLTRLAGKPSQLGRQSLNNIRSLASAIFTHAVNTGSIESNPWHDVKVLGRVKQPVGTAHYTLAHATQMIAALKGYPEEQAIIALACFLGMRPGEIQGLQWEDITPDGWIHIRRAVVRRIVGETKTRLKAPANMLCSCGMQLSTCQRLPLIEPVRVILDTWRDACHGKVNVKGWVFQNRMGRPGDVADINRRIIKPILKAQGIEYKGLYPGRRGVATILTELTRDAVAAQQLLRHSDLAVTTKNYIQMIPEALMEGAKLLEAAIVEARTAQSRAANSQD